MPFEGFAVGVCPVGFVVTTAVGCVVAALFAVVAVPCVGGGLPMVVATVDGGVATGGVLAEATALVADEA